MSTRPYMQLYVSDYLGDTMHLTCEQHGAYLLMLMALWNGGGSLPNDPVLLARICRVTKARFNKIAPNVMPYFKEDGDRIIHQRLSKELQKVEEKVAKKRQSGKQGGLAKSLKNNKAPLANASCLLKQVPEPEPEPDNTPLTPLAGGELNFNGFWELYPASLKTNSAGLEVGKKRAQTIWSKMNSVQRGNAIKFLKSNPELSDCPSTLLRKADFESLTIKTFAPPDCEFAKILFDAIVKNHGKNSWAFFENEILSRGGISVRDGAILVDSKFKLSHIKTKFGHTISKAGFQLLAAA